jgi:D-aminoacyl-tRNA deacylase
MPLILFTKNNVASAAIAKKMNEIAPRPEIEPMDTGSDSVLAIPTGFDTDCIIVLSPHRSKTGTPVLTAHFPGNWDRADMGGEARALNIAHGMLLKRIIRELEAARQRHGLDWPVAIEADHHGPKADVPIIFVEIGSTEKEWKDERAAVVVAEAVNNAMKAHGKAQDAKHGTFFGVGGGHYAKEFTKLVLERDDFFIGHICPKYAIGSLEEDTFRQAVERNTAPVRRVVVLKGGTNAEQKKKVRALCEKCGVSYEEA